MQSAGYESRGGLAHLIQGALPGDLDENNGIDEKDLFLFTRHWKTVAGQSGYDYRADLNRTLQDQQINEKDLLLLLERLRER